MKWQVNFFDKHGTDTRNMIVNANTMNEAESIAAAEADKQRWPQYFKVADAEPFNTNKDKNIAIAKFMKIPSEIQGNFIEYTFPDMDSPEDIDYRKWDFCNGAKWKSSLTYYDSELRYHLSWDWLIPVVKEIIPPNGWELKLIPFQTTVVNSIRTFEIDNIHQAVFTFCDEYNFKESR